MARKHRSGDAPSPVSSKEPQAVAAIRHTASPMRALTYCGRARLPRAPPRGTAHARRARAQRIDVDWADQALIEQAAASYDKAQFGRGMRHGAQHATFAARLAGFRAGSPVGVEEHRLTATFDHGAERSHR